MTERPGARLPGRARRVLRALVPILCPPEAEALGLGEDIVAHVEQTVASWPRAMGAAVVAALHGLDLGACVAHGRGFARLDAGRASRHVAAWQGGPWPLREALKALRALLCFAHYEMPRVQEELGYRPAEWADAMTRRRLERYPDDIRRQAERLLAPDPLPRATGRAAAERA